MYIDTIFKKIFISTDNSEKFWYRSFSKCDSKELFIRGILKELRKLLTITAVFVGISTNAASILTKLFDKETLQAAFNTSFAHF